MQEFSYLGKIALLSISFSMILTQIITQVYKDSLTLTYTSSIKYLAGITILITTDRSFNTLIDDDYQHQAFTYIPDQNWWEPSSKRCSADAFHYYEDFWKKMFHSHVFKFM
jgi:hypothetical protein